jgi:WD40 repeat protein
MRLVAVLFLLAVCARAQEADRASRLAEAAAREQGVPALLLAREACRAADREECRTALYAALAQSGALPVFRHGRARVWGCGMPRDAERVYSVDDAALKVWKPDGSLLAERGPLPAGHGPLLAVRIRWWAFDHGRVGLVRDDERLATLYDASGREVAKLSHAAAVSGIWIGGKGRLVVTWTRRHVRLWDGSGRPVATLPHPRDIKAAYPRLDGKKVVTVTDRHARVYTGGGRPLAEWKLTTSIAAVRWATSTDRLLLRSDGKVATLVDASGDKPRVLGLHTGPMTEARFSYDGNLIVTTSLDGRAILWNALGEPLRVLQHAFPVRGAEFLPKGRYFVTYGRNEAWLWGSRGFLVARLRGHARKVNGVGYSGQADRVVTCADDGTVRLWPIVLADALALAAQHAGRDFTAEERRKYAGLLEK